MQKHKLQNTMKQKRRRNKQEPAFQKHYHVFSIDHQIHTTIANKEKEKEKQTKQNHKIKLDIVKSEAQ